MKIFLFILAFITCITWDISLAQNRSNNTSRASLPLQGSDIVYRDSVSVPGHSKEQLFTNALEWYNSHYKTADTKMETEDNEKGLLEGVGAAQFITQQKNVPGNIFFSFVLQLTNEAYAYKFNNIYSIENGQKIEYADMYREELGYKPDIRPRWSPSYRAEALLAVDSFFRQAISQLKIDMSK